MKRTILLAVSCACVGCNDGGGSASPIPLVPITSTSMRMISHGDSHTYSFSGSYETDGASTNGNPQVDTEQFSGSQTSLVSSDTAQVSADPSLTLFRVTDTYSSYFQQSTATVASNPAGQLFFIEDGEGYYVTSADAADKGLPTELASTLDVASWWRAADYTLYKSDGAAAIYNNNCTVIAREEVTVPAGRFETFKVSCARSMEYHRYSFSNDGTLSTNGTYWIHPSIGIIKYHLDQTMDYGLYYEKYVIDASMTQTNVPIPSS